jgi:uncharacterized protein YaaN involved in tellurite resistance
MTAATAIQVAFPRTDEGSTALVVPSAPETPANTGLVPYAAQPPAETRRTLSCKDLLQGDTHMQAEQEAQQLLEQMLENSQVFMTYGTSALEGVNALVNRLLHEVEPTKIPELTQLMRDLNQEMRGVKRKYDVSDPKVREKYEKWKGGVLRFIGQAKTLVELLMEDVQSIEGQIDKVGRDLTGRQLTLLRNVSYYDVLYEENEAEILKLIYVIGVMELVRDMAAQRAASIEVGDANLGDRRGEQRAKLAELSSNMEIKIAEYKGRLMVAWATSPQVRMMRTLNVGLAERLNELVCVTIPTMKATILQWRMLMESQDAARMSQVVQEASNEWLQAYAAAGAEAVPMIAEAVQTPTLTPQTIAAMADSVSQQADGIIHAMELGNQRRQEMDVAMIEAQKVLGDATKHVSDALIEHVIGTATKPLEIETSISS